MLAIIGGTGIYDIEGLEISREHRLETPYGAPSDIISQGHYGTQEVFFLPRHGRDHRLLPGEVNYRANIWALKRLGVTRIIGISAVGSLQREIAPGELSLPSQYLDFVRGPRSKSFFGDGLVAHVSTAEPTCATLAEAIRGAGAQLGMTLHRDKTYACVDGPRLGTRAESHFLRAAAGADLVGMTNVPEVFLAREAQICYCTIAIATDYDCWMDDPAHHVTVEQVIRRYGASLQQAKELLGAYLARPPRACQCGCRQALESAVLTPAEALTPAKRELLSLLRQ